jgi:hypothetical protein
MGRDLVATMTDPADRARADPLLDWLCGACVRLGTTAELQVRSLVDQSFQGTTPDARVIKWVQARVGPYLKIRIQPALGPGPPVAGRLPPLGTGAPPAQLSEKEYSALETSKIQAACGLTDAQWATDLPEIYSRMLEEGRTTSRIKALLEDTFRPDDDFSLEAVHLGVTDEMAKDLKELNFGFNRDLSHDTSQRGISPFAVIGISMATASRRRRQAERYSRANNLTLTEVTMADTTPDPIPTQYHGAVNLIRRYLAFLEHLVGGRCVHYVEVRRIAAVLNRQQHIFEELDARQIASLLWQIFLDARRFFSAGIDARGNLPQSLLRTTFNEISAGVVQAHLSVPYGTLLSTDTEEAVPRHGQVEGTYGASPRTESKTFRHVPPTIKTLLRGARSKYPSITIAEMMAAHEPPLQYAQVKLGPSGSCLDFLCLGSCKNNRCSYKHPATATIAAARASAVGPKLGAAYSAYDAANT